MSENPELEKWAKNKNFSSAYWGIIGSIVFIGWIFTGHLLWFVKYFEWIKW